MIPGSVVLAFTWELVTPPPGVDHGSRDHFPLLSTPHGHIVQARVRIPILEGEVATLSIEVDVQCSSLIRIVISSRELNRTLERCERQRKAIDQGRQRYEELGAVETRREERLKGLGRLNRARAEVARELTGKESAPALNQSTFLLGRSVPPPIGAVSIAAMGTGTAAKD
jgi:hypothetical protein